MPDLCRHSEKQHLLVNKQQSSLIDHCQAQSLLFSLKYARAWTGHESSVLSDSQREQEPACNN